MRRRRHLHLPDASRDPAGRTRRLPDLRHGARAGNRRHRHRTQSRTRRHDAPVLDRPRAHAAGLHPGNGRACRRRAQLGRTDAIELRPICLRDAGRAVGRLAVLRARLAIAGHAQSQHVHADRHGHRRRLCLQPGRHVRAGNFPGRIPRPRRCAGRLFRSRQRHHRAGVDGPGAGIARARGDLRRDPRAARSCAQDRAPREG